MSIRFFILKIPFLLYPKLTLRAVPYPLSRDYSDRSAHVSLVLILYEEIVRYNNKDPGKSDSTVQKMNVIRISTIV